MRLPGPSARVEAEQVGAGPTFGDRTGRVRGRGDVFEEAIGQLVGLEQDLDTTTTLRIVGAGLVEKGRSPGGIGLAEGGGEDVEFGHRGGSRASKREGRSPFNA